PSGSADCCGCEGARPSCNPSPPGLSWRLRPGEPPMHLDHLNSLLKATLPMGHVEAQTLPGCPQITLGLINADFPLGPLPAEVMHDVIARPAYWALCWGSGLALARHLLDQPQWVAGRTVVDLGSGSGLVAVFADCLTSFI